MRPDHILIITTDHHRFDAFSRQGCRHVRTPNLDALADVVPVLCEPAVL